MSRNRLHPVSVEKTFVCAVCYRTADVEALQSSDVCWECNADVFFDALQVLRSLAPEQYRCYQHDREAYAQ